METENRAEILRGWQICRFCLEPNSNLRNIYEQEQSDTKTVPLPLQIMACVGIEVFENDGMPQLICHNCQTQAHKAYVFKSNCKEADDALKLFLATGTLMKPHLKKEIEIRTLEHKRSPITTEQSPLKRTKRIKLQEQHEVITLNYSNDMEITQVPGNLDETMVAQGEDDSALTEGEQTMEEDDSGEPHEKLNPTLKVKQVRTDCFPCDQCERSFPLKQLLDLHKSNHDRERSYECEECNKKFFTKYDLLKHMKGHTGAKPYTCVVCKKTFSRESLLHRHEKVHVDVPKYLCTQCDKTFLTREDLDLHAEKHKKERPYTCVICNKSFVFKQGLERHLQTHSVDKPHKCNYCEASFTSTIKLTRHITSHAGLRPYPCKLCGRTFLLSHHLTRHMRSHYAGKNSLDDAINKYKCDLCSMSFKRKDSLINHTAIHSMVNLKCVICNTSFDDAASVKKHINTHLSGLSFPCDKCDYSFETQEQLEEHEVKHAEMEYEEIIEKEVKQEIESGVEISVLNKQGHNENVEEEEEAYENDEDEDFAEFTITNDINNPEVVRRSDVVRRSSRQRKVKDYAQFLKDEVVSDEEAEQEQQKEGGIEEPEAEQEYTIKPIVRSEGTKVYTRKSTGAPQTPKTSPSIPSASSIAKDQVPITIDNITLSNQELEALPTKKFIDMKIGNKLVRVQKLLVSKNEMLAMAREGKIEVSGKTFVFRKQGPATTSITSNASPFPTDKHRHISKRVYERRSISHNEGSENNVPQEIESLEEIPAEDVSVSLE